MSNLTGRARGPKTNRGRLGEEGLIEAIWEKAVKDAKARNQYSYDARRFLQDPIAIAHLVRLIGIDEDAYHYKLEQAFGKRSTRRERGK